MRKTNKSKMCSKSEKTKAKNIAELPFFSVTPLFIYE